VTGWPDQPVVYEVDTWPWLRDLSGPGVPLLRLDQLPAEAWDAVVPAGVDAV